MTHPQRPKVLFVEDDDNTREALMDALGDDAAVAGAVDGIQAIRFIASFRPDVNVLDLLLDASRPLWANGSDIPRLLNEKHIPVPPTIVVSSRAGGADFAEEHAAS